MTLFFFLSGLFLRPSLKRKGILAFIGDRLGGWGPRLRWSWRC